MPSFPLRRRVRSLAVLAAGVVAACADATTSTPPGPRPVARLSCTVSVIGMGIACGPSGEAGGPTSAVRGDVVGGQGTDVCLQAEWLQAVDAQGGTEIQASVTLKNLLPREMGVDRRGIDVFYHLPPSSPTGTVQPVGTRTGTFTAAEQEYVSYPGVLAPGAVSEAVVWRWRVNGNVPEFAFQVFVSAALGPLASDGPGNATCPHAETPAPQVTARATPAGDAGGA